MYGGIFMNQLKELANELEHYFLIQQRYWLEAVAQEAKRQGRKDLDDIVENWYKYCVDGKPSTNRYRVIKCKLKELNVEQNSGADRTKDTNTAGANTDQNSTEQPKQQGMFSKIVDGLAAKIKNNRGLIGVVAGVCLTYAGQAAHSRYQIREVQKRDRRAGDVVGMDNAGSNTSQ